MALFLLACAFTIALQALKLNSALEVDFLYVPACKNTRFTEAKFDALRISGVSACLSSCFKLDESSDYSAFENVLHESLFDVFLLVERSNRRVLGTVSFWTVETELEGQTAIVIYNVCLSPRLRGKGNGEFLIQRGLKMHYSKLGERAPRGENPVLLVLNVKVNSPSFLRACNLYRKLGFYSWECGNFASKENWVLQLEWRIAALKKANCSRLWSCDWNCQCQPVGSESDWHVTMYRLDFGTDGMLRFALPPTNFCQRLKQKIGLKVQKAGEIENKIFLELDSESFDC